ncbi:MAG: hypothetical protein Q9227_005107 [Pyrenula ochraceoflavens]
MVSAHLRPLNFLSDRYICHACRKTIHVPQPWHRPLHASSALSFPRRRDYFSSNATLKQQSVESSHVKQTSSETKAAERRKNTRSPAGKTSLKRVAFEAERSRDQDRSALRATENETEPKLVTAYAVAEQFDLAKVNEILRSAGYEPDPLQTHLYPQVTHLQIPVSSIFRTTNPSAKGLPPEEIGDIFVFPSGTVVTWALPEGFTSDFATRRLIPAATNPHVNGLEVENLDFVEDSARDHSSVRGDTIIVGTKPTISSQPMPGQPETLNTVLTKIAFSSGFARSTKLAVLETMLADYIDSTRNIPTLLSRGSRLPFTRSFILQKTGQLLSFRAQLNLYSELTDSLPDLFWDSRHELNLEGCYDQVGKALDVNIRIRTLNEKMDYAQEIASVLRERLSEKHGLVLEWTIITLIAVEVGFEILRLWRENKESQEHSTGSKGSVKLLS